MSMAAYVLDHDEKSFFIEDGTVKNLRYDPETGNMYVNNQVNNEVKNIDYSKYLDFKFSFHTINFDNEQQAKRVLEDISREISKISKDTSYKKSWNRSIKLSGNDERDREKVQRKEAKMQEKNINIVSKERVYDEDEERPVLKYKVEKTYKRESNLNNSIISIHTHGREESSPSRRNYVVKPHIHILFPKKNYFGKKLSYLRTNISNIIHKRGVSSSLNTDIQRNAQEYKEYKILKDRLSNFSWVVAKHQDKEYLLEQLNEEKYNNKHAVNLDNVEEKINRYLELGGSYDFARKLKINMENKLNQNLDLKIPQEYKEAEKLLEEKNYSEIINYVYSKIVNREKLSERFVEFAEKTIQKDTVDIKDAKLAKYIKKAYQNRGFKQDHTFNKIINQTKLNYFKSKYKNEIEMIKNHEKHKEQITEFQEYLNQNKFISKDKLDYLIDQYDIKNFEAIAGETYVNFLYNNHKEHLQEYLSENKLQEIVDSLKYYEKSEFKWKLRDEINKAIENSSIELPVKYKYKIIYDMVDSGNLQKALEQKRKRYNEQEVFKFLSEKQKAVIQRFEKRYNTQINSIDNLKKIDDFLEYKQGIRQSKINNLENKLRKVEEREIDYKYTKRLFNVLEPDDEFYQPVIERLEGMDIAAIIEKKEDLESRIDKLRDNRVTKQDIQNDASFAKEVMKDGYVKLYQARYREFDGSQEWDFENIEMLHKYNKKAERFVKIEEYQNYYEKIKTEYQQLRQDNLAVYKEYKELKDSQKNEYSASRENKINQLENKLQEPKERLNNMENQLRNLNRLINGVENNLEREKDQQNRNNRKNINPKKQYKKKQETNRNYQKNKSKQQNEDKDKEREPERTR